MTRPPYHRVNPTRPRPGRVPKQRSAPPPTSTSGKSSKGGWCLPTLIVGILVVGTALVPALTLAGLLVLLVPRRRRLPAGDYIDGNVYVIGAQMDPDFVPPSGSLNPAATVAPISPAAAPSEGWGQQPGSNSQPVGSGLGQTAAGATRASAPAAQRAGRRQGEVAGRHVTPHNTRQESK